MRVLMITGDRQLLREGSNAWDRLQLQRSAVEELKVVYWGRGALLSAPFVRGNFDVVTAQDPLWRGLSALFLARKIGAKLNVQVHADLSTFSYIQKALARFILSRADSVRVVSEKIKTQIERMGVSVKITVLPVFVDIEKFAHVVRRDHAGKNILWIGRFEEEKDPLAAVAILEAVLKKIPDAQLTMLGDGSLKKKIQDSATHLPVSVPGWRDPVPYLEVADVVLCTSEYESWGSSIVESLASGVSVVAPDVGIAKEAGAIVVPREKLAETVEGVLASGRKSALSLSLLPASAWAVQWRQSLL